MVHRPGTYVVYLYEFPTDHKYVGCTNDLKRRHRQHRVRSLEGSSLLYRFVRDTGQVFPSPVILWEGDDQTKARQKEREQIAVHRSWCEKSSLGLNETPSWNSVPLSTCRKGGKAGGKIAGKVSWKKHREKLKGVSRKNAKAAWKRHRKKLLKSLDRGRQTLLDRWEKDPDTHPIRAYSKKVHKASALTGKTYQQIHLMSKVEKRDLFSKLGV